MKRRILSLLVVTCFSMAITDGATAEEADLSLEQVVNSLQSIHAVEWQALVQSEPDRQKIRYHLNQIINEPEVLNSLGKGKQEIVLLREKAIGEYGKFTDTENGHLSYEDVEVFQSLRQNVDLSDPNDRELFSLMESLKNANTPETTRMLLNITESEDRSILSFALTMIEQVFTKEKQVSYYQSEGGPIYSPNAGVAMVDREDQADWKKVLAEVSSQSKKILKGDSVTDRIRKKIERLDTIVKAYKDGVAPKFEELPQIVRKDKVKRSVLFSASANKNRQGIQARELTTERETKAPSGFSFDLRFWLVIGGVLILLVLAGVHGRSLL
jgi:hypothetical protein